MIHIVNLCHVPFPVVLSRKAFASLSGIFTVLDSTVKLLLLLMTIIDVSLKMRLGAESLATIGIVTLVILDMITLVVL